MAKCLEARSLCFGEAEKTKDYDGAGNMLFVWEEIKWYDSNEGIAAIVDFVDWCLNTKVPHPDEKGQQIEADECFRFVRMGEETDDIEEAGNGFWDVGVRRSISY
jgi:hypothetical protein